MLFKRFHPLSLHHKSLCLTGWMEKKNTSCCWGKYFNILKVSEILCLFYSCFTCFVKWALLSLFLKVHSYLFEIRKCRKICHPISKIQSEQPSSSDGSPVNHQFGQKPSTQQGELGTMNEWMNEWMNIISPSTSAYKWHHVNDLYYFYSFICLNKDTY